MAFFGYFLLPLLAISVQAFNQYQNQFGNFPNRPAFRQPVFPTMLMPTFQPLTFPPFPAFPTFSPEDIVNKKVGPGVNYNGIAVSSSSSSRVDKDGKVTRTGGMKVITNRNGVVEEHTYPEPGTSDQGSTFPRSDIPLDVFPQAPLFPIQPLPVLPPVDDPIITKFKPGENEEFRGRSIVSYSHMTNINGDVKSGGVATVVDNDNGRVQKKTYKYGDLEDY